MRVEASRPVQVNSLTFLGATEDWHDALEEILRHTVAALKAQLDESWISSGTEDDWPVTWIRGCRRAYSLWEASDGATGGFR